jgi:retinol dehydrogenase-12
MTSDLVRGRTFLVTGANSGIGQALAERLAAEGGRLVLAARSPERTMPVLDGIRASHPGIDAQFLHLDVSDFGAVRRAAGQFLDSGHPLDVLVNNAGVGGTFGVNAEGFDLTYATNHLGPFLLTNLLLPRLRESPAARIVNVSSVAHYRVKRIDWSVLDRHAAPVKSGFTAYATTKMMNVLHAKELARRLAGTSVTTSALHPGAVATNIWRSLPRPLQWVLKRFMLSSAEGARTPFYCATSSELRDVSGRYYDRCREVRPNPLANDVELAGELWRRSEAAVESK